MNDDKQITEGLPPGKGGFVLPPLDDPKYRAALGDDITEEEATEFLRALDSILRIFVDIGFGVDAVQQLIPELAKIPGKSALHDDFSGAGESKDVMINAHANHFNNAATEKAEKDD